MSTISHDRARRSLIAGKTVFDYADELAVAVPTSCGRSGRCHECVVEIERGMAALTPRSEAESFLRGDYRLACQAVIARDDVEVAFAPLRRKPKILTLARGKADLALHPAVVRRGGEVLYDGEAVDRARDRLYGLAIDLGTTTVVMELVDLETGGSIATSAFENPQRFAGSDVMHRISYDAGDDAHELQRAIVTAVNRALVEMSRRLGVARREIYEIVVAGNSTMRDILFGLDIQPIGQKPYKSTVELDYLAGKRRHTALLGRAREVGLGGNPRARLYGLPLIASHVGADTAADLLAVGMAAPGADSVMLVDVGTNTEVVLAHRGRLLAASCPAGPAFEGGEVKYGMPGYDGAIESLSLRAAGGGIDYSTIGNRPPEGICGSGLIDLLAELRRQGRMTAKGVFADRKQFEMMLLPEYGITFSKRDAGALGQAKAANYCGQFIVMREMGLDPGQIATLYLAGGFANYVDVANAIEIGFLPPVPAARIVKVGNAAIRGAREVLLSLAKRHALERFVTGIEHIELETTPDFFDIFVEGCQFKPMPARLRAPAPAMKEGGG